MICDSCKENITNVYISGVNMDYYHPKCYHLKFPFVPKKTFDQVLGNMDDQIIVKNMLYEILTHEQKRTIVDKFNEIMLKRWIERVK
jgi:hypothetical protein